MANDWRWPYWPVVPLYPYGQRRTLIREVVPETIWVFEQVQGIFYVVVPIRMTVIRLAAGGLLVYAPLAPTPECLRLLRQLEAEYGVVQAIVQPTVTGIEHKVFVGPFARQCPQATVYVAPYQWSFPVNLPLSWLGLPRQRTQVLNDPADYPHTDEFDWALLGPISLNVGPFAELTLCHRATDTLLVTDSLVSISATPPAVLELDPLPLLFHGRDQASEDLEDTPERRQRGWQRIVLFGLYFRPGDLEVLPLGKVWRLAQGAPSRRPATDWRSARQAYFGLLPWQWRPGWQAAFERASAAEAVRVAPILATVIFNRQPEAIQRWLETIQQWSFTQVIPAHFSAPVAATPEVVAAALSDPPPDAAADLSVLQRINRLLVGGERSPQDPLLG